MLVNVHAAKCIGIEAVPILVEIEVGGGVGIHLVGLADAAVKESLLRFVTALQAKGFRIPGKKIVINLAPADLHKSGSGYDLPIALGIIQASEQRYLVGLEDYIILGEMGLDGSIREIPGALPITELAMATGRRGCILPLQSALEAADCRDTEIYGVKTLDDVLEILMQEIGFDRHLIWNTPEFRRLAEQGRKRPAPAVDFGDIIGQEGAKRGLEIAASGGHNVIMIGAPGSGKSSLAKALPGILPEMNLAEALVTSKVYSVAGKRGSRYGLMRTRPYRAPHGTASLPAIIGGGTGENIMPGEVSLAQNGILFLDEMCEMPKKVLESLRGPIEDRKVVISRLKAKIEYPADFMLVAASNPCPCGYYGEGERCSCTVGQREAYLSRLSGPIMDRIDIHLWLHPVDTAKLVRRVKSEPSEAVAARVLAAREIQARRLAGTGLFTNAQMNGPLLEKLCPLSAACNDLMEKLIDKMGLSARAYTRIIKIARTIADLAAEADILPAHIAEAASYRFLDRQNITVPQ